MAPKSRREGSLLLGEKITFCNLTLAEARKLKQQAERKSEGALRERLLRQSAELFQKALQLELAAHDYEEGLFDLAETFLLWSNAVKNSGSFVPGGPFRGSIDKPNSVKLQMQTFTRAAELSRLSFEMFEKVSGLSDLKQEAIVNSGISLSDWGDSVVEIPVAEGGGVEAAKKLYLEAHKRYSTVLAASPNDIETLVNLGDCCLKLAEVVLPLDSEEAWAESRAWYENAVTAYSDACSKADVRIGDDLCGILQNWGAALVSKAKVARDSTDSRQCFDSAREKLRNAVTFSPTSVSIHNALGEVSIAQADLHSSEPHEVLKLIAEAEESFKAALRIDSSNLDALLGIAEAHYLASKPHKLLRNSSLAEQHYLHSTEFYLKCVTLMESDNEGKYGLSYVQQCDVLFNLACSAALCGRYEDVATALKQLIKMKGVTVDDLSKDSDFENVKSMDWFSLLLRQANE